MIYSHAIPGCRAIQGLKSHPTPLPQWAKHGRTAGGNVRGSVESDWDRRKKNRHRATEVGVNAEHGAQGL